jgi:hypothetical protein
MFKGCVKVKYSGATRARSLCFIALKNVERRLEVLRCKGDDLGFLGKGAGVFLKLFFTALDTPRDERGGGHSGAQCTSLAAYRRHRQQLPARREGTRPCCDLRGPREYRGELAAHARRIERLERASLDARTRKFPENWKIQLAELVSFGLSQEHHVVVACA